MLTERLQLNLQSAINLIGKCPSKELIFILVKENWNDAVSLFLFFLMARCDDTADYQWLNMKHVRLTRATTLQSVTCSIALYRQRTFIFQFHNDSSPQRQNQLVYCLVK